MTIIRFLLVTTLVITIAPVTAHASSECHDLVKSFFIKDFRLADKKLKYKISKLGINTKNKNELESAISLSLNENISKERAESYLSYISYLLPDDQIKAAKDIHDLTLEKPKSSYVKKFNKYSKRVEKYKNKHNKSTLDIKKYEKRLYGCKAENWTPERKLAKQRFKKFALIAGTGTGAYGYINSHSDEEKNIEWYKKLGYEVIVSNIFSQVTARVFSSPTGTPVTKGLKKWLTSRIMGPADMMLYSYLFGATSDDLEAEMQTYLEDPKKIQDLSIFIDQLDDRAIYHDLKDKFRQIMSGFGHGGDNQIDLASALKNFDFSNLTQEDLNSPVIHEILKAAITDKNYQGNSGSMIKTGNIGLDRYLFYSSYGLALLPLNIPITLKIYDILCMGDTPTKAFAGAAAVYLVQRMFFDQLHFYARKKAIGQ